MKSLAGKLVGPAEPTDPVQGEGHRSPTAGTGMGRDSLENDQAHHAKLASERTAGNARRDGNDQWRQVGPTELPPQNRGSSRRTTANRAGCYVPVGHVAPINGDVGRVCPRLIRRTCQAISLISI